MFLGLILGFCNRFKKKLGIGKLFIQYIAIILILPIVLILGLEKIIESSTVSTILGAFVGYVLSDIGYKEIKKSY